MNTYICIKINCKEDIQDMTDEKKAKKQQKTKTKKTKTQQQQANISLKSNLLCC